MAGFYDAQNNLNGPFTYGKVSLASGESRTLHLSDDDEKTYRAAGISLKRNVVVASAQDSFGHTRVRDLDPNDAYATTDIGRIVVLTTDYTLKPEDSGTIFRCENSSTIAVTIPANLPQGFNAGIIRYNATVNLTAGSGATQRGTALAAISAQYKMATVLGIKNNAGFTALEYLASEAG